MEDFSDSQCTCLLSLAWIEQRILYVTSYEFNVKKSGIMVFGEEKLENARNDVEMVFRLDPHRVYEHTNKDGMGFE